MPTVLKNMLENLNTFPAEIHENMTVIGVNISEKNNSDLMSLEIGLNLGLVEISEVDENGSVNEVKIINKAVTPLLLIDGEEIIGSKQNRIINSTIIIPAKSEKIIPVSCTEAGRWNYNSTTFHYSKHMANSRVRRDKLISVSQSLKREKSFRSNQNKVWSNIREIQDELEVDSTTNALHDSFVQRSYDIESYKKSFTIHENQNGLIVYINGELVGFEIMYNSRRYKEYHDKIIESYILDAISKKGEEFNKELIDEDSFLNMIKKSEFESYDSVGLGVDYRIDTDNLSGSAVIYNNKVVSASFFMKDKN
ncbi:MAG: tubulin-like protein [Methanosphaera sp.]|nr:tubulin-like protein [Methanosphaera sp.]